MTLTKPSPGRPGGGQRTPDGRRSLVIGVVVVLVALIAGATSLLVLRGDEGPSPSGPGTGLSATSAPTPSTTESTTPPSAQPSQGPTGQRRSAAEALGPFLSAAAGTDRRLTEAAAAINGSGPPWTAISEDVARKVHAASTESLGRTIPAGVPHDLLQSVVLVLSDLESRWHAMSTFENAGPVFPDTSNAAHRTNKLLLAELAGGHAAAARFDRDLAAARALAAATPPIASVPKQSRLTAEVMLLAQYAHMVNAGCDARGGVVLTKLPVITWGPVPHADQADGTIGPYETEFSAKLTAGTWQVYLLVC
jgi:hypothetical protein